MNTFKLLMFLPSRQLSVNRLIYESNFLRGIRKIHALSMKQEDVLKEFISNQHNVSVKELKELKQNVLSLGTKINNINYDAHFIGFCYNGKRIDIAKTYFQILKAENNTPNNAVLGKLLKLYYLVYHGNKITEDIEKEIYSLCESFKKTNNILDSLSSENAILALSLTKNWKKCFDYLDNIRFIDTPSAISYSVIIEAAFKNNEANLAWNLLKEMLDHEKLPTTNVYKGIISCCNNKSTESIDILEKLFEILQKYAIIPPKEFAESLSKICNKINIAITFTEITNKGECIKCNNLLTSGRLTTVEFESLKNAFFNSVMIGKNLFTKTTPKELENFISFIKQSGSFDIVIDGLNVLYSCGRKNVTKSCELLANVVKYFVERKKKVLIVGRTHMKQWKNKYTAYVMNNAQFFFVQDISEDDPFLIYATMYNGPNTGFVSRDLMRNHLFKLKDQNLKILFRRWQNSSQYKLMYMEDNGKVHISYPTPYLISIQQHKHYWHIPLESTNSDGSNENSLQWICLKKLSV